MIGSVINSIVVAQMLAFFIMLTIELFKFAIKNYAQKSCDFTTKLTFIVCHHINLHKHLFF